jgi:hypothetical protein
MLCYVFPKKRRYEMNPIAKNAPVILFIKVRYSKN